MQRNNESIAGGLDESHGLRREKSSMRMFRSPSAMDDRCITPERSRPIEDDHPDRSSCRACLRQIMNGIPFNAMMLMVVFVNFVAVIIQTDSYVAKEPDSDVLEVIGLACLGAYVLELSCRIMVEGWGSVNTFGGCVDFAIVGIDLLSTFLQAMLERSGVKDFERPQLAVLRVFRVLRLVRGLRSTLYMRELYLMVTGMLATIRAIIWSTFLLGLILITWSIITVVVIHPINEELAEQGAYDDCERCARAYSSVLHASLTYFQSIIAGDSWGMVTIPIIEHSPWTIFVFLPAVLLVALGVMNLVVMVICDSAAEARDQDVLLKLKEKRDQFSDMRSKLLRMCKNMDSNNNGDITYEELLEGYHTDIEFRRLLNQMDIYQDEMALVFKILDEDHSGVVTFEEFADSIYKMKLEDSHTLLIFIKSFMFDIHRTVEMLAKNTGELPRKPSRVGVAFGKRDLLNTPSSSSAALTRSEVQVHTSDAEVGRESEDGHASVSAGPTLGGEAQGYQKHDGPPDLTEAAIKDSISNEGGNGDSKETIWLSSQICTSHSRLRQELLKLQRDMLRTVDSQALLLQRSLLQGAPLQESNAEVMQVAGMEIGGQPIAQAADSMSTAAWLRTHEGPYSL